MRRLPVHRSGCHAVVVGLTYVINKMRSSFGLRGILRLNRTIGSIVLAASMVYAAMTLFNLSLY